MPKLVQVNLRLPARLISLLDEAARKDAQLLGRVPSRGGTAARVLAEALNSVETSPSPGAERPSRPPVGTS